MDKNTVFDKICGLIEELTDIPADTISEESGLLDDLELSSFEIMTMFTDMEELFDITISEDEVGEIITVGDVTDCILNIMKL